MKQPRELLTAADIEAMSVTRAVHSLNPHAIRLKKSVGDIAGLTQLGAYIITLMPGHESSEYHRHLYEEECVYMLSGQGQVWMDEQAHDIGPGDFLGFPRQGIAHVIINTCSTPLTFLVVGQRLEQDVCEYPHKGLRLYIAGEHEAYTPLSPFADD